MEGSCLEKNGVAGFLPGIVGASGPARAASGSAGALPPRSPTTAGRNEIKSQKDMKGSKPNLVRDE
jgi:hypothetical protein